MFKTIEVSSIKFQDPVYGSYDYSPFVKRHKKEIDQWGLLIPLVVDEELHLIAGQCRYLAIRELGWREVDVRIVETRRNPILAFREQVKEALVLDPWVKNIVTAIHIAKYHEFMCELSGDYQHMHNRPPWTDLNRYNIRKIIQPQLFRGLTNLPKGYILIGMKINIFKCLRCGHEWPSKQEHPRICPKCKSPYWDRPRREKKGG